MISKSILTSVVLLVSLSFGLDVMASGFLFESEINAATSYDDNVILSSANEKTSSSLKIEPKVKLTYKDNNWDTSFDARVASTSYSSEIQNETEAHLDLGTAYESNRDIYSLVASYKKYSNRAVEATSSLISLPSTQINNTSLAFAPKYTRLLTQRTSLSLSYKHTNVDVDPENATFLPYQTNSAIGSIAYDLSQKSQVSFEVSATDYSSENDITESEILGSNLGIVHNFSEMVSAKVFAGVNTRDFTTRAADGFLFSGSLVTGSQVESSSSGGVYEAVMDAKWIVLTASRANNSNTLGGLNKTDTLSAKLRMQVTPLVGLTLLVDQKKYEELNDSVLNADRVATKIMPAMNLTLTRDLSLRAEYVWRKVKNSTNSLDADSNKFYVNLKYKFPSI